ncbi:hypothetical protein EDF66_11853 [Sphingobacterium sp. JUb20]|nr:hypothetical protein [Sphingobacterium sp. JUb21]TCQ97401.1 hypothetical protein EDF66_11853 [Sphingobacterium sp. JUb20]
MKSFDYKCKCSYLATQVFFSKILNYCDHVRLAIGEFLSVNGVDHEVGSF